MHRPIRATVLLGLLGVVANAACVDSNEPPAVAASIVAFTGTPQVIRLNERVALRWRVENAQVFRLMEFRGSAMPDATQPWSCTRAGDTMECTAPSIPASAEGWTCAESVCRRPVSADTSAYEPVELPTTATPVGTFEMWPDETTTYRIEAEGTAGAVAMAWVQAVVNAVGGARIVYWYATPSPALAGEPVTFEYQTEGCDQISYVAFPYLDEDVFAIQPDYTPENGQVIWAAADETRDFYLDCHPTGADESARIRSHITVPVIEMPEICERIDRFVVTPGGAVHVGERVHVEWEVNDSFATSVNAESQPATSTSPAFHITAAEFVGFRDLTINAEATLIIRAQGECGGAEARHTVTLAEECTPDCEGRECGPDGCDGSCGPCEAPQTCDPVEGICM